MLWLVEILALFFANVAWRTTGIQFFGYPIVRALGSHNENVRTIAGIWLVKAGKKAEPLLEKALQTNRNLPTILTILADIGDRRVEPEIRNFSRHEDPQVAEAARHALRVLEMHR